LYLRCSRPCVSSSTWLQAGCMAATLDAERYLAAKD
jgi:hypothetical protein